MRAKKARGITEILADGTLVHAALVTGVREALRRHKQAGHPIVEWRNGRIVWIPPQAIRLPRAGRAARVVGRKRGIAS